MTKFATKDGMEPKLLKWCLILSSLFWFFGAVKGIVWTGNLDIVIVDYLAFLLAAICLLAYQRGTKTQKIALIFCLCWLPLFAWYWLLMGGVDGPFSYTAFVLMVVFLALLDVKTRYFLVIILCLECTAFVMIAELGFMTSADYQSTPISSLATDYVLTTCVLAFIVVFIKRHFDKERKARIMRNDVLVQYNEELQEKHSRLTHQQEILGQLKNNLEALVRDRTQEQELRHHQLQDYAYDNAHIIRGPLTSIMALVHLMKMEMPENDKRIDGLDQIYRNAADLDVVIRKINQTLH